MRILFDKRYLLIGSILSLLTLLVVSCKSDDPQHKEEITVTFDSRGGEPSVTKVNIYSGESVSAPKTPTKEKSAFKYWYLEQTPTEPFNFNTPIKTSTTLFAQWTQNVFTVSFDTRGGVPDVPKKIVNGAGGIVSMPTITPSKPDSVFTGWYTSVNEKYDFGLPVRADVALHAEYVRGLSVTFNYNNGTTDPLTIVVRQDELVAEPSETPKKNKYLFSGWYKDAATLQEFDFTTPITGNINLYAGYVQDVVFVNLKRLSRVTGKPLPGEDFPSPNRTDELYNVSCTDLGIIWEMEPNRVGLLFGDTFGGDFTPGPNGGPNGNDWRSNVLAISDDLDLEDGITISGMIMDPANNRRARQIIPRRNFAGFTSIPSSGINIGGDYYVHYLDFIVGGGYEDMYYSSLYRSKDKGATWETCEGMVRFPARSNFGQIGYARRDGYVYMVGTETGRAGQGYLARFREKDILNQPAYEYWNGTKRQWVVGVEREATPILDGTVGELSVLYNEKYRRWIVMYFDAERYAICYRTATKLNGTWSQERVMTTGWIYPQLYGSYMHPHKNYDDNIYFTMSMWGPYNVFMMRTEIQYID